MAAPVSSWAVLARAASPQAAKETSTSHKKRQRTETDEEDVVLLGPPHATFHSSEDANMNPSCQHDGDDLSKPEYFSDRYRQECEASDAANSIQDRMWQTPREHQEWGTSEEEEDYLRDASSEHDKDEDYEEAGQSHSLSMSNMGAGKADCDREIEDANNNGLSSELHQRRPDPTLHVQTPEGGEEMTGILS